MRLSLVLLFAFLATQHLNTSEGQESQDKISANTLYKEILDRTQKARTLRISFTTQRIAAYPTHPTKGVLTAKTGNRIKIVGDGTVLKDFKYSYVCDGKIVKAHLSSGLVNYSEGATEDAGYLARTTAFSSGVGTWIEWLISGDHVEPWSKAKQAARVHVSNLELLTPSDADKNRIGLRYALEVTKEDNSVPAEDSTAKYTCTLWLSADSRLPVRREVLFPKKGVSSAYRLEETYDWRIDEHIDDSEFVIP